MRSGYYNERGFESDIDYRNWLAQQNGFIDDADYQKKCRFERFGSKMSFNTACSSYLGVFIAERLLPDIFQEPKMMPHSNRDYDAICKNGYTIDVKSSVYLYYSNRWIFTINYNEVADFFLCIAFDSRVDLNVKHIWLIPGGAIIRNRRLSSFKSLNISDSGYSLSQFLEYELKDKLDKVNDVCVLFKKGILK